MKPSERSEKITRLMTECEPIRHNELIELLERCKGNPKDLFTRALIAICHGREFIGEMMIDREAKVDDKDLEGARNYIKEHGLEEQVSRLKLASAFAGSTDKGQIR